MPIVDTDVLVDVLRRHPPAMEWLRNLTRHPFVSGYSVLELFEGCRDMAEARKAREYLSSFPVAWLTEEGCNAVVDGYPRRRMAGGLGIIDALIAQTAIEMNEPVFSFNTKHFAAVEGLTVVEPYER